MYEARKPCWKRRRWIAVAILWLSLPILYPLSIGPAFYAWYSGWLADDVLTTFYTPIFEIQKRSPTINTATTAYCDWWFDLYARQNPPIVCTFEPSAPDTQPATDDLPPATY